MSGRGKLGLLSEVMPAKQKLQVLIFCWPPSACRSMVLRLPSFSAACSPAQSTFGVEAYDLSRRLDEKCKIPSGIRIRNIEGTTGDHHKPRNGWISLLREVWGLDAKMDLPCCIITDKPLEGSRRCNRMEGFRVSRELPDQRRVSAVGGHVKIEGDDSLYIVPLCSYHNNSVRKDYYQCAADTPAVRLYPGSARGLEAAASSNN